MNAEREPLLNPECAVDKCINCDHSALDEETDEIVDCEHGCHVFAHRDAGPGPASSDITIPLPWQRPPLSQNDRNERTAGGARRIAEAKAQARWSIRAAKVRPIAGCEVLLEYRIPDRIRRDADNLAVLLKVCQDALVLEGVLPDDSWVEVPASGQRIHPPEPGQPGALWLTLHHITEYAPGVTQP